MDGYVKRLGKANVDAATRERLIELASLEVLLAQLQRNALLGLDTDLLEVNRLVRTCARQRRSLGLDKPAERALPSLQQLLKRRVAP